MENFHETFDSDLETEHVMRVLNQLELKSRKYATELDVSRSVAYTVLAAIQLQQLFEKQDEEAGEEDISPPPLEVHILDECYSFIQSIDYQEEDISPLPPSTTVPDVTKKEGPIDAATSPIPLDEYMTVLYRRHSGEVIRYLEDHLYSTDGGLINELVQEVFALLYHREAMCRDLWDVEDKHARTSLFTIARNVYLDYKRRSLSDGQQLAEVSNEEIEQWEEVDIALSVLLLALESHIGKRVDGDEIKSHQPLDQESSDLKQELEQWYDRVSRHCLFLRSKSEKGELGILVFDARPDKWRETLYESLRFRQ